MGWWIGLMFPQLSQKCIALLMPSSANGLAPGEETHDCLQPPQANRESYSDRKRLVISELSWVFTKTTTVNKPSDSSSDLHKVQLKQIWWQAVVTCVAPVWKLIERVCRIEWLLLLNLKYRLKGDTLLQLQMCSPSCLRKCRPLKVRKNRQDGPAGNGKVKSCEKKNRLLHQCTFVFWCAAELRALLKKAIVSHPLYMYGDFTPLL